MTQQAGRSSESRVFSIPPGAPFLPTLVEALLDGTLVEGFVPRHDPLLLADATIWLPTRRAARALASEFVTRFNGEAALLPQIHALGDTADEAESLLSGPVSETLDTAAVDPMRRQLTLAILIEKWVETLSPKQRDLYAGAEIVVPSSTSDAVRFAAQLAELMDTVATEEADWSRLKDIVPDDYADWWQLTLDFLKIATKAWPAILAENNLQDGAVLRVQNLRRRAAGYAKADAEGRLKGPVIAAGSTGSIPATAELLKTVSRLSRGAVVLPGLDRDMEPEVWAKIDLPDNDRDESGTAPGHPQYGLKKLLGELQIDRSLVQDIGTTKDVSTGLPRTREALVSEALRPANATDRWHKGARLPDSLRALDDGIRTKALDGIALIEAAGQREEALAIALALRETLETDGATCALVTPDRNLARRVAVEMRRFGVPVDDSAGLPLHNRPPGTLSRLIADCAFGEAGTIALASLIKHPLARFGATPARARRGGTVLELACLRGSTRPPALADLPALLAGRRFEINDKEAPHKPPSLTRLSLADWEDGAWLAQRLSDIFAPDETTEPTVANHTKRTVRILEACAQDEELGLTALYGDEAGQTLEALLADMLDHGSILDCDPGDWPDVFGTMLDGRTVRPLGGTHPRVTILGPIEVRLQTYDRVVLGGLNEKSWPDITRNDPFLSRPMKQTLGLPAPERRTGLAAHDFQMLLGMKDVVLTRSLRTGNAPSIPSRWLQRLLIVAGEEATKLMLRRGKKFLDWAEQIDAPAEQPHPCPRPAPAPPNEIRPKSLSITEIEKWIRDPYEIYAKHILKLVPLDAMTRETGPLERGTLVHAIMEDFAKLSVEHSSEAALLVIARRHFDAMDLPPDVEAIWRPRFQALVGEVTTWQRERRALAKEVAVELSGKTDDGLDGFTLRGRADRIDRLQDGSLAIFDYKTGAGPSKAQAESLLAPQLPLEAAMAKRGAFGDGLKAETSELAYVRLRASGDFRIDTLGDAKGKLKKTIADLEEEAWTQLRELINAYKDPKRGYTSRVRPPLNVNYESDYSHLARVGEWSVADDEAEEGGGA